MKEIDVGGGSLLVAIQLKGKKVLVIGGGSVAATRVESLLHTDAHITVMAPSISPETSTLKLMSQYPQRVTLLQKAYIHDPENSELLNYDMILTALDDIELSRTITQFCRDKRIPVNAADIPELCDFYFGSTIRNGPLQILVSTNGNGPRMARILRKKISETLTGHEGTAISKVGDLRMRLKERTPAADRMLVDRRMQWMSRLCDVWTMDQLSALNEEMITRLLVEGWENDVVPSPEAFGLKPSSRKRPFRSIGFPCFVGFCTGFACAATWNWLRR